ncbi:hypothetical protein [Desulfobacula sp.]|uniref:hypothetical protein n=1 Tax=Desulfobacula sp. TaxID=2593537 RepID=UPI0025C6D505|nr:hypothetical protein [Desulfobacula sp.]MBC2704006.1 hypothetical protein [Desulfobacula sp.]
MVFERRMSEFRAVSEGKLKTCCNVHPADVRESAFNRCKVISLEQTWGKQSVTGCKLTSRGHDQMKSPYDKYPVFTQ